MGGTSINKAINREQTKGKIKHGLQNLSREIEGILAHAGNVSVEGVMDFLTGENDKEGQVIDLNNETFNNKKYTFLSSGNPESDNIIIHFHGLVGNMTNFALQLEEDLLKEYRQYSPNRRKDIAIEQNISLSKKDGEEIIFEELDKYFKDFIEGVTKGKKVFVHGVSLGGEIAYKYAAKHPEQIQGIILSGASGLQSENLLGTGLKRDLNGIHNTVKDHFYRPNIIATRQIAKELFDLMINHKDTKQRDLLMTLAQVSKAPNIEKNKAILTKIGEQKIPVSLIRGSDDHVTPADGVIEVFSETTGVNPKDKIILPKIKHIPNMDISWREYNKLMAEFVKKYGSKQN